MEKTQKIIYGIDAVIVLVTILVTFFATGYVTPLVIAPQNEFVTTENTVLFEFENADRLLIDDNVEFTSPELIHVKDNFVITLNPGTYYWKVEGIRESEIREFTIQSEVNLKLKKSDKPGEVYEVTNAGNTRLHIDIYDKGEYVGDTTLDSDKSAGITGSVIVGGEE